MLILRPQTRPQIPTFGGRGLVNILGADKHEKHGNLLRCIKYAGFGGIMQVPQVITPVWLYVVIPYMSFLGFNILVFSHAFISSRLFVAY